MADVNISDFSDTEIAELAARCLDSLSLSERVQTVLKAFHSDEEREELLQWLRDEESEEESDLD